MHLKRDIMVFRVEINVISSTPDSDNTSSSEQALRQNLKQLEKLSGINTEASR